MLLELNPSYDAYAPTAVPELLVTVFASCILLPAKGIVSYKKIISRCL